MAYPRCAVPSGTKARYRWPKRLFDLVLIGLSAVVWLPVILCCALAIYVTDGRPMFYVSRRRVGPGQVIPMVKFRTMVRNADKFYNRETVPVSNNIRFLNTPPDSPLYTSVGRLIERFALTEVPQIIHVLRGEMSIVGNRPLPENVIDSLSEAFPRLPDRLLTPAGMTGPAQLVGREAISDGDRLMLEYTYCCVASEAYSWVLDLRILIYTVLVSQGLRPAFTVNEVRELMLKHAHCPGSKRRKAAG
ncbi:MAG: sugar transferase [Pseudomonadota bacterium]